MAVKVYSTQTCPWCDKAKDYLKGKGVAFDVVDVGADRAAAMDMVKKTRQMGVPVVQIGERYIVGFDVKAIDSALAEDGLI
ncbi:glutathione S-transferase N-terminal domain-containing protein [Aminithiophilus ramosus]|uniref:Glutathione S-transferase N-terminal domain-containing protein n=2 Tax=Synergistales TaxID=649776 RepID=A0A9Q7EZ88_9BACT|nr:glutaredoxin domain-containing protein [Aminithiophilus ramosus]QTX31947.1 glutathione S-transferase N-terminal domain-containing protein [Aminithiophilus ramosus]QVL35791.1 glutathione S-transferase N-terminal domain-containing protein [Synergistota bacterium]